MTLLATKSRRAVRMIAAAAALLLTGHAQAVEFTLSNVTAGTEVVWTHVGSGTGNFGEDKHVFGFTVTAPGASTGTASFATTGFSTDISSGAVDRNISILVEGPVDAVPEPEIYALMIGGLGALGWVGRRRRKSR